VSAVAWLVGAALLGGLPNANVLAASSASTQDRHIGCTLRARVVIVNLPNWEDGPVLRHAWRAEAEHHWTDVWHIDRPEADVHRVQSLRGIPTWGQLSAADHRRIDPQNPNTPHDRDEVPPAMALEGGAGADVEYIVSSVNRSAGSIMQHRLAPFCDGQSFRYERRPGPK
jgi:hypothetical protein